MKPLSYLVRAVDKLTNSIGVFSAWLLVPLVIVTCYEVFARYVLTAPTTWAYEIGYMLTGSQFLLGLAYTLKQDSHVRIDLYYTQLSKAKQALVNLVGYGIAAPVCAVLSLHLFKYAREAYLSGETSGQSAFNPVLWPFRAVFFVAFVILSIQLVAQLLRSLLFLIDRKA